MPALRFTCVTERYRAASLFEPIGSGQSQVDEVPKKGER